MVITRQNRSIIIETNDSVVMEGVQRVIDYINILKITAKNQGTEEQSAELPPSLFGVSLRKTYAQRDILRGTRNLAFLKTATCFSQTRLKVDQAIRRKNY